MKLVKKLKDNRYLDISTIAGLDSILPKVSGTGTNIMLEGTANASMKVTGACTICGKNLFNLIKGDYSYGNGLVTWNINDGKIILNRTSLDTQGGTINLITGEVSQWANFSSNLLLKPNTKYTLSFTANGNYTKNDKVSFGAIVIYFSRNTELQLTQQNSNKKYIITLTSNNAGYLSFSLYGQFCTCENFELYDFQLEEGSTSTDYEPYQGMQIITSDNLQTAHSYEGITNIFADKEITAEAYKKISI